ncbi:MAG: HAD-IIA family hydrolase [Acidimicrobiales bacterium]
MSGRPGTSDLTVGGGILLDIDGVLTVSWEPLPGAVDAVAWLREHGVDFRLVTNTSSRSRRQIASLLVRAGFPIEAGWIHTAVTGADHYLAENYPEVDCLVVNHGDLAEDLPGVRLATDRPPGVILLGGAGPSVGYAELDTVFKLATRGVPIVALHRNSHFQTAEGPALDMGAFIVGIEAAADVEVHVVGKPAPEFFQAVLSEMGIGAEHAVMVGDDITSDVLGAQALGITGVLVRTGKFRPSDLIGAASAPDHLIDDIAGLSELVQRLSP